MIRTNTQIREAVEETFTNAISYVNKHASSMDFTVAGRLVLDMADWLTMQNDLEDPDLDDDLFEKVEGLLDDVIGWDVLDDPNEDTELPDEVFRLTIRGCDAGGYPECDDNGFIVFSGSVACPDTTHRFATRHPGSFELRRDLIEKGYLAEIRETGALQVTHDLWFETAARAASILAGDIRGADAWHIDQGDTYEVM
jgi:hypothetical protein